MSKNDPAFPTFVEYTQFNDRMGKHETRAVPMGGVTKRELFAGLAMLGLLSDGYSVVDPRKTAMGSVYYADALIKQLEESNGD